MQIHSDSRMNFTVMNADGDKVYNQKGIVVVFQNGELIPAWGNEKFVSVVLSEKDAMAEIPFYANTAENEYAYIGAFYFNTYNQSEETLNHQNLIELFQIVS